MVTAVAVLATTADAWQQAMYAFLAEKERRSGSCRTVEGCWRMPRHFFGQPGRPTTSQEVFGWAYGVGLSGQEPSAITIGARLACLSGFYRFLFRMKLVVAKRFLYKTT